MCGIFAVFGVADPQGFRARALALSKRIRHRGPDWNGIKVSGNNVVCHERLAIVGVDSGAQPLTNEDDSVILTVNGEIYNHLKLRSKLQKQHNFKTHSDCEVILYLWEEFRETFINDLDGFFSFALYDARTDEYLIARDPLGITTLYIGWRDSDGSTWVSSEMKTMNEDCDRIEAFPPGHYYSSKTKQFVQYYHPTWYDHPKAGVPDDAALAYKQTPEEDAEMYKQLRESLERAVKKRLMSEVPFGVLLSGGLDSSIISAITVRTIERMREEEKNKKGNVQTNGLSSGDEDTDETAQALQAISMWPRLHSFSIGLPGAPDLKFARIVADFLGTAHHEYTYTFDEGLDAIPDVIYHLETYDVTTIRASTPMYLLSRRIKSMGVKMVLSGEGSDEIFGGYLYFHYAPDARQLHHECIARIQNLNKSDNLRANKSTMAWGLESRVPFQDRAFLDVAMNVVPANHKLINQAPYFHKGEKFVIRKAFDTPEKPYLPDEILWRQKEQFSDGVGYSWIDGLKDHAEKSVSDVDFAAAAERFPHDTPTTKEAYYYRQIFEQHFPQKQCLTTVMRWIPRKDWGCPEDPSGRAQKVHEQAYEKK
ncbi:asparagine synthetase [Gonapodya sp. JEL0774]|nr:asparagine synthetase [Gonapodya sp. JEL0774]